MFTQFRIQYPNGSLISEFVAVNHGKYIVRALVEVDGVTLATGLAAADTVEAAEDQARNRALALLILSPNSEVVKGGAMGHSSASWQSLDKAIETKQPTLSPPKELPVAESSAIPSALETSLTASPASTTLPEEEVSLPQSYPIPSSEPLIVNDALEEEPIAPENPLENLDYDEMYVQTGVEIKRLAWTEEQGRTYLLENYGKRSRKLLGAEELAEFLHYLQSLPTPKSI